MHQLRLFILPILVISLCACTKTDEAMYGICGNPLQMETGNNGEFEGIFKMGQREVSIHEASIRYMEVGDTSGYFRFSLYELDEDSGEQGRTATFWLRVNDTTYFYEPVTFQSISPWVFYEKFTSPQAGCKWFNDSSGYVYTEQLDSLHYRVDCRALLEITQSCSQFEPDTVFLRIDGIFRFVR